MHFQVGILKICCILAIIPMALSQPTRSGAVSFDENLHHFSQNIFNEIIKSNSDANVIFSPISVQTCLAMARIGADGQTAEEMDHDLGFTGQTRESIADNFHYMLTKYENSDELNIANKVYVMQGYTLQDKYKEVLSKNFYSTAENIDFAKSDESAKKMNTWIEAKTNHKVKDMISPDMLSSDSRLFLVSTIHFKADWEVPFHLADTTEQDFYVDANKAVKVPMMNQDFFHDYADLKDMQSLALRLPYNESSFSMLIILPHSRTGLSDVLGKLKNTPLTSLKDRLKVNKVNVMLPKFKSEFEIELTDTLKKMGMKQMFESADFGQMLYSPVPLKVSNVVHKAFIEVTELGTEAGGAAGMQAVAMSVSRDFIVNHPFYYAIIDEDFVPIFQGTVVRF